MGVVEVFLIMIVVKQEGVCMLFSKQMEISNLRVVKSNNGRFLHAKFEWHSETYLISNIYGPNEDDPEFFNNILEFINEQEANHIIIGGDLNVILDPELDRKGPKKCKISKAASLLNAYMNERGFQDMWRILHPDIFRFMWRRKQPLVMSRLDYFLCAIHTANLINNCEILPGFLSDHSMVILELNTVEQIPGRGFWKLNNSFLKEKDYVEQVNEILDYAEMRYKKLDPSLKWESTQMDVAEFLLQYSQLCTKEKKIHKKDLLHCLNQLEKKLSCINLASNKATKIIKKTNIKINGIKKELDLIASNEIQGMIIRSKARWYEHSEKNSKYFYQLEKIKGKNKVMKSIKNRARNNYKSETNIRGAKRVLR